MGHIIADGGCLCGAVRYQVKGELIWSGYCHCESCRRHTASPVASFIDVNEKDLVLEGQSIGIYASSPNVERSFCKLCGTPISYMTHDRPGEIQLYAATLDDPEKVPPSEHVHWEEKLSWLELNDELPKHDGSALAHE